jgi:HK97 gp10 family phage protein
VQLGNNMATKGIKLDFSDVRKFERGLKEAVKMSSDYEKIGLLKAVTLVHREAVNNTVAGVKYSDGIYESGNLRRSLSFELKDRAGDVFISRGLQYPTFVEFGTKRMRAKPFLSLAISDNIDNIKSIFKRIMDKQIKKMKV